MSPRTLSNVLHFIVGYRWFIVPGLFVLVAMVFLQLQQRQVKVAWPVLPLVGSLGIATLIWGLDVNNAYVHRHGVDGSAVVTKVNPTSITVNEVPVLEYEVLLKMAEGQTLETSFLSSSGKVYPEPSGAYHLPGVGQPFTIRYIPGGEENFIIHSGGNDSVYTRQLQCGPLFVEVSAAQSRYSLDKANPRLKEEYRRRIQAYLEAPCGEPALKDSYRYLLGQLDE